jgi:hypothetical protein
MSTTFTCQPVLASAEHGDSALPAACRNAAGISPIAAMCRFIVIASSACLWAAPMIANAASDADSSRGALLYETHCSGCHTTQAHWRDKRLVRDRESLTREVSRWQANESLQWSADDIDAVARYLDRVYYRLPSRAPPPLPNRG